VYIDLIIWDDENDPDGNYRHIVGTGEVTAQEVEAVISGHTGPWRSSRSSGNPIIFGTTSKGLRLAVVFMIVPDPDDVLIYPITAYPVED
jgi:hypothetical protein